MLAKKLFYYTWFPISLLLNAVSLINLQKDLFPSLYKWVDFFNKIIDNYENVQDILFYPIIYTSKVIIGFEIPRWILTYFTITLIFTAVSAMLLKDVYKMHPDKFPENERNLKDYIAFSFLLGLFFPLLLFISILSTIAGDKNDKKELFAMFKYFSYIIFLVFILIFINYIAHGS